MSSRGGGLMNVMLAGASDNEGKTRSSLRPGVQNSFQALFHTLVIGTYGDAAAEVSSLIGKFPSFL